MRLIAHSVVFLILVISMTGCSWFDPEPPHVCEPVTKIKYVKQPIPKIEPKPEPMEYDMIMTKFKGQEYYVIERSNGMIMSENWESYKSWAERNYNILKSLETNSTK